jgi:hypothetical protein
VNDGHKHLIHAVSEMLFWLHCCVMPCMYTSVADPHHIDADPDPTFHPNADPDPAFQFDADPDPTTHFLPDLDPPMLQNDPQRLPPFHFDADPDPASQNDADSCGSGSKSATLICTVCAMYTDIVHVQVYLYNVQCTTLRPT